jgi:hypothetical protein
MSIGPMTLRLALLSLLSGCAVDCTSLDWQQRGHDDGYGGHPPQDLVLMSRCARVGVQVSQADYLKGYEVGYDEHIRLKTMNCD